MTLAEAFRREALRCVMAFAMVVIGVLHFVVPARFTAIVPAFFPLSTHLALVLVSGFFEVLGGVGLLVPRVSRAAAWGLVALYVAVYPANINMAVNHIGIADHGIGPVLVWARLPFQFLFIWLAYRYTKRPAFAG